MRTEDEGEYGWYQGWVEALKWVLQRDEDGPYGLTTAMKDEIRAKLRELEGRDE